MRTRYAEPYEALAEIYDHVMNHVDYKQWANYIRRLLPFTDSPERHVADLACGTGNLLSELKFKQCRVTGCDISPAMLRRARIKPVIRLQGWMAADFTSLPFKADCFDAALVLYDSINYLLEREQVLRLFSEAARILKPGGQFIFDAATPFVCETAFRDYEEKDVSLPGFPYLRRSWYDAQQNIQYNHFSIQYNGEQVEETHQQKIRSLREWRRLLEESPLQLVAAYGGFGFKPANKTAERIHFVCEKRTEVQN